jgi:hypothetical protein
MFAKRLVLVGAALAIAWHFRWLADRLEELGVLLWAQPPLVRLAMAVVCLFVGIGITGDGFRAQKRWYQAGLEIIAGVAICFLAIAYWRTMF